MMTTKGDCVLLSRLQTNPCIFVWAAGRHAKGGPRDAWQSTVHKDLSTLRIQHRWFRLTQDQTGWRQLIALVRT